MFSLIFLNDFKGLARQLPCNLNERHFLNNFKHLQLPFIIPQADFYQLRKNRQFIAEICHFPLNPGKA